MPEPASLIIRPFEPADRHEVIALWHACDLTRPWNNPDADLDLAMATATSTVLVGTLGDHLAASVMTGFDGHRGWVYYLAVAPSHQGSGYGRAMLSAAENWLTAHGTPKVELMVRETNMAAAQFYERLGYERQPVLTLGKWLRPTPSSHPPSGDPAD